MYFIFNFILLLCYPSLSVFRFQTWTDASDFMKICHPLGDATYYLGYMFVSSQKPTSKGLVAVEEVPIDGGSMVYRM